MRLYLLFLQKLYQIILINRGVAMKINEMETIDIKMMLTSMNNQIKHAHYNSKLLLKQIYKDHIKECENELKKRGVNYESCIING